MVPEEPTISISNETYLKDIPLGRNTSYSLGNK
jgi:hypothetical protein